MTAITLGNGVMRLALQFSEATAALSQALTDFLQPWFVAVAADREPDLTASLLPSAEFPAEWRARCTTAFVVRRSSASLFNLEVERGTAEDGLQLVWDKQRHVGYAIDTAAAHVTLYGEADTAFIHLIELVRYYGLLTEQARGTVVLHSAAVRHRDSDDVVALVGAKGTGKTTTMFSMLESGEYVYFSGDKLLLDQTDDGLRVRGWPDYPHIGMGTLRGHPELADQLGVDLVSGDGTHLPDQHKVLLEPSRFLAAVGGASQAHGRLSRIVLPRIHEGAETQYTALTSQEKAWIATDDLFEWPHRFITATWHGLPWATRSYQAVLPAGLMQLLYALPWDYRFGMASRPARPIGEIR